MTTAHFDAKRAIREEMQGLADIRTTLVAMERRAREELALAETKHETALKLMGFLDTEVQRKRDKLAEIERKERNES